MAQPTYTLEELSRKVDAISEFLNEKTDRNLLNLNSVGQEIIDGKVEVEALLAQNGYAKFTWKEDNKVANVIINWIDSINTGSSTIVTYPHAYIAYVILTNSGSYTFGGTDNGIKSKTLSNCIFARINTSFIANIIAVGY